MLKGDKHSSKTMIRGMWGGVINTLCSTSYGRKSCVFV